MPSAAGHELQVLAEPSAFVPAEDLLDAHRGRADHPARHDELVVRQFFQVNQGDRAVVLGGLQRLHHADVGVAATAGAEHRAAPGQGTKRGSVKQAFHDGAVVVEGRARRNRLRD
jgi:hypothetical protein